MLEINVIDVLKVENNLSIAGKKIGQGSVSVGATLSDGENLYKVTGLPFVRYKDSASIKDNICVLISADGISENNFVGKTLRVENYS